MFGFMVTADGGLTTAGYVITIIAGIVMFFLAIYLAGKNSDRKKLTARQLVFCAMAVALAFVTSYLKIFSLPWGGSVTLCSMIFIVLIANWYGVGTGIMAGLAYGILQFIQEPYVLSFFQVCCDYILAFAALSVAGFFAKQSHGLLKGYIVAVIARGAFHSLGGYLYWMSYMPENFPHSLTAVYPIAYNYSYLLAEGIITEEDVLGSLGDVINGKIKGRENDEEIIVYETVGVAAQDLVAAKVIYDKAVEAGKGLRWGE